MIHFSNYYLYKEIIEDTGMLFFSTFARLPYSFFFHIMDVVVLREIFRIYDIPLTQSVLFHHFLSDLFGEILGLHCTTCLVVLLRLPPTKTILGQPVVAVKSK